MATSSQIGISGFRRNAAAAAVRDGRLAAMCEQGRLTRVRNVGVDRGGFPDDAVRAVRAIAELDGETRYVTSEDGIASATALPVGRLDHHYAHAATSFLTSGWNRATVLVVDRTGPQVSAWRGFDGGLHPVDYEWEGPGFADVYSRLTTALGFSAGQDEREVEALARIGSDAEATAGSRTRYAQGRLETSPDFDRIVADARALTERAAVAARVQKDLIQCVLELLADLSRVAGESRLCVGGGLFYNSAMNTAIRRSRIFEEVFVPVDPGNAGLAVGCALSGATGLRTERASPFLGPSFDNDAIKQVLDNCKLQYEYCSEGTRIDRAVDALGRGRLVGWFEGALEWGARALGHRSILASPLSTFALENLNAYLKHRPPYWSYGVAVPMASADRFFEDAHPAPFMEGEFLPRDERLLALGAQRRLRVQTVDEDPTGLSPLLHACERATGMPVLINTSFNGFQEPMVCSPRDAVRVFYGTGLDLLIVGSFVIQK